MSRRRPTRRAVTRPRPRKPRASRDRSPSRWLRLPVADGMRSIAVRSSEDASLVGRYWNAVHKYVALGDAAALEPFEGVSLTARMGEDVELLTNRRTLDRLAGAGVLSFESIYSRRV